MKLVLPLEHRIQAKAEKYADEDLQQCAIEVDDLKREIIDLKKARARVERVSGVIIYVSVAVMVCSAAARWLH